MAFCPDAPGTSPNVDFASFPRALAPGCHDLAGDYLGISGDCLGIADDQDLDRRHKRIMIDTRLRLIGKWNAKRYGDRNKVEEGPTVEDATDEQILDEIRRQFQQMVAQGFDIAGVLRDAGVDLEPK